MKRCADCGKEFETMAALIKHRRTDCGKARSEGGESARREAAPINTGIVLGEMPESRNAVRRNNATASNAPFVIPTAICPSETRYLGRGQTVGLRVMGRLVDGGVQVDNVEFVR